MPFNFSADRTTLLLLSLGGFLLLCFGLMSSLLGVPAIVTIVIFACFIVVLASALGCAASIRTIEKNAEAEEIQHIRSIVDEQIHLVNSIILRSRPRISACDSAAEEDLQANNHIKNLVIAKRVVNALEIRLNKLLALVASDDIHQIRIAKDLSELPLVIAEVHDQTSDSPVAARSTKEKLPDLISTAWSDTLDLLLSQAEQQTQNKERAA